MESFPVTRVARIRASENAPQWLVEDLWGAQAVGFIGGSPKSGKTWLALELAVAVASGAPCLGRHRVLDRGPVLLYAAEDTAAAIKQRVTALARARHLGDLDRLAVGLIRAHALRLDHQDHQARLECTLASTKPKMLILDPFVRLHNADENSATDISQLLGFLRHLQRDHELAIVVVHHIRKAAANQPGQALRGSGDLHAWSDSSLYLLRRKGRLELRAEHRSHPSPSPFIVELCDDPAMHLALVNTADEDQNALADRVVTALRQQPMTRTDLRDHLRVRNERLGETLAKLETNGQIERRNGRIVPIVRSL